MSSFISLLNISRLRLMSFSIMSCPTYAMFFPNEIDVNDEQFANAKLPIDNTLSGIVTDYRFMQLLNTLAPMLCKVSFKMILVNPVQSSK